MAEGQRMTAADVVAQVRDGRLEDFVREAVVLAARELMEAEVSELAQLADLVADRIAMRLAGPRPSQNDEWLDTRRAAEYLGIHRDSLRRLAAERAIPTEQAGAGCKLYFKRCDLDAWRCSGPVSLVGVKGVAMAESSEAPRRVRVERGIYRRATGVLEVGLKDEVGRQRWRTVDGGILAARKVRDDLAARRARGESVAPKPKLKFGDAADSWLEGPVLDLRETTQAKYRTVVNEHLRPRLGARRCDAIVADDLARLVREMRTELVASRKRLATIQIATAGRTNFRAVRPVGAGDAFRLLLADAEQPTT
jgi:excisionase family DNA binding protein